MTFRWKFFILYSAVFLTFGGLVAFWTIQWLEGFQRQTVQRHLRDTVEALSPFFDPADPEVDEKVDQSSAGIPFRITVIDPDGWVRGDSSFSGEALRRLENHLLRDEIQRASRDVIGVSLRYSTSTEQNLLYVAKILPGGRGFLRVAAPLESLGGIVGGLGRALGFRIAALALLGGALILFVSWRLTRSISLLTAAAERIAEGEPQTEVPIASKDELGRLAASMQTMARQLEKRLAQIRKERNHLDSVLNSMAEGVMATDGKGRIWECNPAFLQIFAIDSDPVGKMPLEVIRSAELMSALRATLERNRVQEAELRFGGQTLLARFSPISIRQETGVVAVFHDISELRRLERVRKDFVANVSHELKTPLTSIMGYAETLQDGGGLEPVQAEFLGKIRRNADALQEIIEALLEMSRLEAADPKPVPGTTPLGPFFRNLEKVFSGRLEKKGIKLSMSNLSGLEAIEASEPYLQRILYNLVDNALKYTERGEISVCVEPVGKELCFSVSDTGVGIAPEDRDRVFERFFRAPASRSLAPGTGIGLSIVRHVVQLLGGRVWLESELGVGTTVRFTLPQSQQTAVGP